MNAQRIESEAIWCGSPTSAEAIEPRLAGATEVETTEDDDEGIDSRKIEDFVDLLAECASSTNVGNEPETEWFGEYTDALARELGREPWDDEVAFARAAYRARAEQIWLEWFERQPDNDNDAPEQNALNAASDDERLPVDVDNTRGDPPLSRVHIVRGEEAWSCLSSGTDVPEGNLGGAAC